MDIESDESERWEDFFGSSTDLAPSVIGYYDHLTNNNPQENQTAFEIGNKSITAQSIQATRNHTTTTAPINQNKVRNFSGLSQSVQRMISHSKTTVSDIEKTTTNSAGQKVNQKKLGTQRRHPQIHIPLSKTACKLSQSGQELVESVDVSQSSESLDDGAKTPVQQNDDELKTPTNPNRSFIYDRLRNSKELTFSSPPTSPDVTQDILNDNFKNVTINITDIDNCSISQSEESLVNPTYLQRALKKLQYTSSSSSTDNSTKYPIKSEMIQPKVKNKSDGIESDTSDDNYEDCVGETSNFYVKLPEEFKEKFEKEKSSFFFSKKSKDVSPTEKLQKDSIRLSYSRKKLLANKPLPPSPKTSRRNSKEKIETKNENNGNSPIKLSLEIPETSKLKNRPLSAASICSTSSSSSSGSEHNITGKNVISYLASVESLADHSETELVNSNLTVSERAAKEIIESERNYVEDLGQVIRGYYKDWKERACLKLDQLNKLFSNIEEIYEFNSMLLKQLINSGTDQVKIAKCFIDMKDGFNVYTDYCTSYPEAISLLTTLLQASHTNSLLASTQKMLKHNLPLGSYLLKPVQRIMRYHMLLENLRKHSDFPEVAEAHTLMREVGRHIDQVKRGLEQLSRVKELSGIVDGWLGPELTVLGDLINEGLLMENNKARIVLLFQTMLIITKPKEDSRLQFKSYIHCKNLMLVEHLPGEPTSFHVIPFSEPKNQIKLTAKSKDQKRLWANQIKRVMLEHFDIPSRAKELVFKLGDEEDRTPDKNTWKWGNSPTPDYLERRNQYRRSEMRYRSKKARKNITTSVSLDDFPKKDFTFDSSKSFEETPTKPENEKKTESNVVKKNCDHRQDDCTCSVVKSELSSTLKKKNSDKEFKSKNGRSKSEPRIPENFYKTQTLDRQNARAGDFEQLIGCVPPIKNQAGRDFYKSATLNSGSTLPNKDGEVNKYNTKTLPKRIATLKKNRAKTMKETSRFYMDLPDDTILHITESTDNLCVDQEVEAGKSVKNQKDEHIISELLKGNKEFNRILNKPPKKKSIDSVPLPALPTEIIPEPVPQSSDTKTDESNIKIQADKILSRLSDIKNEIKTPEPIYESLRRNVHVPYKFSPVLMRSTSISQNYQKALSEKKEKISRPDSDYVTLDFNADGVLKSIAGQDFCQLSNSDSNINYSKNSENSSEPTSASGSSNNLERHGSFSLKQPKTLLQRFISVRIDSSDVPSSDNFIPRIRKSVDNLSLNFKNGKNLERRISDITELSRKSCTYKQGSENLGSRIAHLDYADPKTLFQVNNTNVLINKNSMKQQRDSVFSLTSSNDSVCETTKTNQVVESEKNDGNNFYEQKIEALLENDGFFRDSAIYSDDNDRKFEYPSLSPQSPRRSDFTLNKNQPPVVPKKPLKSPQPPPVPAKPTFKLADSKQRLLTQMSHDQVMSPESTASPTVTDKSWVFKQIKNFEK